MLQETEYFQGGAMDQLRCQHTIYNHHMNTLGLVKAEIQAQN